MLYHLASHLSTLGERESEESKCEECENEESESKRVTKVSLSHSQRDLLAQEVGVMHQVSYQHFAELKLKTGIIFTSFSFSGKKWLAPPMLDVIIFVGNFPQPP